MVHQDILLFIFGWVNNMAKLMDVKIKNVMEKVMYMNGLCRSCHKKYDVPSKSIKRDSLGKFI